MNTTDAPTYADLVAVRDAGALNHLEYLRAMRAAGFYRYTRVASAARQQASASRRLSQRCQSFTRYNARFTDERLAADAAGANGEVEARYARILLRLSTVADRQQADRDSHYITNMTGARPSDALHSAVEGILAGNPVRRVA